MDYRKTENKFTKSVGGSFKSLIGQSGRTYFILEHKTSSSKFKAGDSTTFTSDYIEIGRNANCALSFGQAEKTVSRVHAAIAKENQQYVIRNLSNTNPTLVNGRPVAREWYLNNGDEIQLSLEGPTLGFLAPEGNYVSSLPIGTRIKAVGREAIRPYRYAVIALSVVLICAVASLTYLWMDERKENFELSTKVTNLELKDTLNQEMADSLRIVIEENEKLQSQLKKDVSKLKKKIKNFKPPQPGPNRGGSNNTAPKQLQGMINDVYYIRTNKLEVTFINGDKEVIKDFPWSGTGFLLQDGRFITARHVVEPWFFLKKDDEAMLLLNLVANNGGKVKATYTVTSPSGKRFKLNNRDFAIDRSKDEKAQIKNDDGEDMMVSNAGINNGTDWASAKTTHKGNISFDDQLSKNLKFGDKVYFLGYSFGAAQQQGSKLQPIFSESTVGQDQLVNGMISVSDRNFDIGNSGGPAFISNNNTMVAVGIVSTGRGTLGNLVPIAATK